MQKTQQTFMRHSIKQMFFPPLVVFICCSLLIAIGVALKSISVNFTLGGIMISRVGFQLLPTYIASILFGPFLGAVVGFFTDLLSMLFFPVGAYTPFYGFTYIAAAIVAWLMLNLLLNNFKGKRFGIGCLLRIIVTVVVVQLVVLLLNTLWTAMLYGIGDYQSFDIFLWSRCPALIFYIPVFSAVLYILLPTLSPLANKFYRRNR